MFHPDNPDDEGSIEEVILACIRKILEYQNPELFFDWARDNIGALLISEWNNLPPEDTRRLSYLLARAAWNATPLPRHGFREAPLDVPPPSVDCPCGSQLPYAACCAQVADVPELPSDLMWELLLGEIHERRLQEALASGKVPTYLLGLAAERFLTADHPGRAIALLEPLFDAQAPVAADERFEHALNVLCDAYDRRDHWRKKLAFLERMTGHPCRTLRAAAWQRLCTIHIDEDDFTAAQFAFSQTQREGPDNPSTALLEITLLASQHEDGLARKRSVFWLHKFRRTGMADEDVLGFLVNAAQDPQEALMTSQSAILDPQLFMLREWVREAIVRPLPTYGLKPYRDQPPCDPITPQPPCGNQDSYGARIPASAPQFMANLCAPMALQHLETRWHGMLDCPKPPSTHLVSSPLDDLWEHEEWGEFLVQNPAAADSLDILDDLATALYIHPETALPWIHRSLLTPLAERAARIIERILPERSNCTIPWSLEENRPALRLLYRLYLAQAEEGRDTAAVETLRTLLRLNPSDEHGVRGDLMNYYLRQHENDKALDLAECFPDDLLADLAYGEILALYRVGAQNQAHHTLHSALARLPAVHRYLTRKRVPRPREEGEDASLRAENEAWLYREAMLDVWEAEPGLLDWLRRHAV